MSLLSYNELLKLVDTGVITNVDSSQINSASVDLTLGPKLLVEQHVPSGLMDSQSYIKLYAREPLNTVELTLGEGEIFYIPPGGFVLAQTEQVFNLPSFISAEYKLKSSMARIGLEHLNAGWCDAGWHGSVLTLELKNMTRYHNIGIRRGDGIGQMVFFEHERVPDDKSYAVRGRYNNDENVQGIKP